MKFKKLSQKQLIEQEKFRDEFAFRLRVLTWTPSDSEQRALGKKSNSVALGKNQKTNETSNKTSNSNDWFFRLNLLVQFNPKNSTRQIVNRAKLTQEKTNEINDSANKSNSYFSNTDDSCRGRNDSFI